MFLFIDGPALVCGWVNFSILWPHPPPPRRNKVEVPPRANNTIETVNDSGNNDLIIPNKELYENIQSFEKYAARKAKCLKECIQLKQRNYPRRKKLK